MMLRTLIVTLGLLAAACGAGSGTLGKSPYSFPSREALQKLRARAAPTQLYTQQVSEVETWTVENTRSAAAQGPWGGELPFAAALQAAVSEHGSTVLVSDALVCVAQETARFIATVHAAPSGAVEDFISARCGSSYRDGVGWLSVETDAAPDEVQQHFAQQLPATLEATLALSPGAIGVGYAQVGRVWAVAVAYGSTRVKIPPLSLEPDGAGTVVVEGELVAPGEMVRALVNRGAHGVESCPRDETRSLPSFRFLCTMAPGDPAARSRCSSRSAVSG